ncbi:ATP-binding protein [Paucibacter sp. JuS9]|uniref:ATP-binding protein n=1 Tax=Paucibacter sp. JuS9 TaxID=3228748 RepID=UPI003757671E
MLLDEFDLLLRSLDESLDAVDVQTARRLLDNLKDLAFDDSRHARLACRQLVLEMHSREQEPELEPAYALLNAARRALDLPAQADALVALARLQSRARMVTQALESFGEAEALYEQLGDPASVALAKVRASSALYEGELFAELLQRFEPLAADLGQLALLPSAARHSLMTNIGAAYSFLDRYEEAAAISQRLYEESLQSGTPTARMRDTVNLANQYLWLGKLDAVERLLREAGELLAGGEVLERQQIFYFQNCALLAWKRGRHLEALPLFDRAWALALPHPMMPIRGRILMRKAECAEEAGLFETALAARKAQVSLVQERARHQARSFGLTLERVSSHARMQGQNEYLRRQGSQLERELAEARDALELKVEQRNRELERAMRMLLEREKQAALTHLVAGVAHELNTPLGNALLAIGTMAAVIDQNKQAFEEGRLSRRDIHELHGGLEEGLALAQRGLERASALVRSFKALALEQAGMEPVDFHPSDVVENTLAVMDRGLREAGVEVELQCPGGQVLHGNPGALGQVLAQLFENSLVHGFRGWQGERRLRISASLQGDDYCLEVGDSGHGIAQANRPRVFDPFFTTRLGQGSSGLGLHLAYRLVTQRLGGEIRLLEAPGGGALFELRLPRRLSH